MAIPALRAPISTWGRAGLIAALSLMWANYALTARWAHIVGSTHGPKQPLFLALLVAATLAALWPRWPKQSSGWVTHGVFAGGIVLLLVSFFQWFPPGTWNEWPFLDNWPTRFQTTVDGVRLYRRGVGVGWQWHFLGGYHSSSDISQTLSTIAAVPMTLFGDAVGFHLTHLLVLLAIPLLVYLDYSLEPDGRDTARLAAGLVAFTVTGWFSYFMTRSGDTNSMAGTFCSVAVLTGSHAAARGRRWGAPLLVGAMALLAYSHTAFFIFASVLLGVESVFYWDRRRALRAAVAVVTGLIAALPLTWESWRYPAYFTISNVEFPPPPFHIPTLLRQMYYNVEIHFLPGRWFNDFTGLSKLMVPISILAALCLRTRAGFYACAALVPAGLMWFNTPFFGYAFLRPVHLLAVLPAAALGGFLARLAPPRAVLALLAALVLVYLQISWVRVPHISTLAEFDPPFVEHLRSLDGAMVLLENAYHRDMDGDPVRKSEKTPFDAHIEACLPPLTGKRFYAGLWDGWQWSSFRSQLLAGGAFQGRLITSLPPEEVTGVLRKWGIRHVVVWSGPATQFFETQPRFARRWTHDRWSSFEHLDADPREVAMDHGHGGLANLDRLGADVVLSDARAGDLVVVRANYYPAWTARSGHTRVPLLDHQGQLAFLAPADGTYVVNLEYPRRYALNLIAVGALLVGTLVCARVRTPGKGDGASESLSTPTPA